MVPDDRQQPAPWEIQILPGGRQGGPGEGSKPSSTWPAKPRSSSSPAVASPADPHATHRDLPQRANTLLKENKPLAPPGLIRKPAQGALTQSHQFPKAQPLKPPQGPCWPPRPPLPDPELPCEGNGGRGAGHTGTGGTGAKRHETVHQGVLTEQAPIAESGPKSPRGSGQEHRPTLSSRPDITNQ